MKFVLLCNVYLTIFSTTWTNEKKKNFSKRRGKINIFFISLFILNYGIKKTFPLKRSKQLFLIFGNILIKKIGISFR